ncbi:MAG: PAS domain-containing sensor histidine kinase [Mariprofundales bacterium]
MLKSALLPTHYKSYHLWWLWLLICLLSFGWYWFISDIYDCFNDVNKSWLLYVIFFILFGLISVQMIRTQMRAKRITEEAYRRIDNLLEIIPDAMLIVNMAGYIVRTNKIANNLFAYTTDEIIGLEVDKLVPLNLREQHAEHRKTFSDKPHSRLMGSGLILSAINKNGDEFPVGISINYDDNEADRLITITVHDVSESEQQRMEVIAAKDRAETALADLKLATDALVEAEKLAALGNLVASVAHEVNTPVGLTLTSATYLQEKTKKVQQEFANEELTEEGLLAYFSQATESTRLMEINARRAAELVQSFKQVAVDQSSAISWREFDLNSYLHEIALSLYPSFKHKKIAFLVDCKPNIKMNSDAGAIAQLITNLVNNALLHAFDDGQTGELFINARKYKNDMVEIICRDDGKGMTKDVVEHIFEPFYTTKRGKGGSGLGMYIVHNLLHTRLHGQISIESKIGIGTRIIIHIPQYLVAPSKSATNTGDHYVNPT